MNKRKYKRIKKLIFDDPKAYHRIFNDMYESLCVFVHRFIPDWAICEDCVQESFISLWGYRDKIDTEQHAKAFLYQTCRNNALNCLKHEDIKQKYFSDKASDDQDEYSWMDWVIEEEVERALRQTNLELPAKCQRVLALVLQGKNNTEIAHQLGISENTVKTQKQMAYKCLKKNISEMFILLLLLTEKYF